MVARQISSRTHSAKNYAPQPINFISLWKMQLLRTIMDSFGSRTDTTMKPNRLDHGQHWLPDLILAAVLSLFATVVTMVHAAALDHIDSPALWREQLNGLTNLPPLLTNSIQFQREWWFFQQRAYPSGIIPADARLRALQQIEQSRSTQVGTDDSATSASPGTERWTNIGPAPILQGQTHPPSPTTGRVADIAVDPRNFDHWLIGAAQGGIWETRDAGNT